MHRKVGVPAVDLQPGLRLRRSEADQQLTGDEGERDSESQPAEP
jgi:hypothetical protein